MRNQLHTLIVALVLLVSIARPASAWNDTGHMLTALLAWEQMDVRSRAWAIDLIEQHPRFKQDFERTMPRDLSELDRQRWLFARAATWPDVARGFDGEDRERYHHATWHYALGVFSLDDASAPPTTRAATQPSDVHLLDALEAAIAQLHARDLGPADRAIALCWTLHLTGDMHQPCHAGSLFSERFKAPDGDRGANNLVVETEGLSKNLHAVWDSMAGDNRSLSVLTFKVEKMLAEPTLARRALEDLREHVMPTEWLAESAALNREVVYDYSVRAAVRLQEVDPAAPFVPLRLSRNYLSDAELVAQRRVALAGHRIADAVLAASRAMK